MFGKLKKLWDDKGFEFIVMVCIAMFLILGVWNWLNRRKGTWTKDKRWYPIGGVAPYDPHSTRNKYNSVLSAENSYVPGGDKGRNPLNSKGEVECRRVLRELYGRSFSKSRPEFLKNQALGNGQNLELDCFDKITRPDGTPVLLGVEYNGIQHYQFVPYFHKNKQSFETQKYRDYIKKQMCKDNGVILIEVPYKVKLADIKRYLITELEKNGLL